MNDIDKTALLLKYSPEEVLKMRQDLAKVLEEKDAMGFNGDWMIYWCPGAGDYPYLVLETINQELVLKCCENKSMRALKRIPDENIIERYLWKDEDEDD